MYIIKLIPMKFNISRESWFSTYRNISFYLNIQVIFVIAIEIIKKEGKVLI